MNWLATDVSSTNWGKGSNNLTIKPKTYLQAVETHKSRNRPTYDSDHKTLRYVFGIPEQEIYFTDVHVINWLASPANNKELLA